MARSEKSELKYEIVEHVADLCEPDNRGWVTQVNVMSWGNRKTLCVDVRKWQFKEDGTTVPGKAITMNLEQLEMLQKVNLNNLQRYFKE